MRILGADADGAFAGVAGVTAALFIADATGELQENFRGKDAASAQTNCLKRVRGQVSGIPEAAATEQWNLALPGINLAG